MKEQKHEVIVNGDINVNKIEKEHIDAMCRSLLRDILEYYQKVESNEKTRYLKEFINFISRLSKYILLFFDRIILQQNATKLLDFLFKMWYN